MTVHLYFSLIPEALIASNLPPEKFGQYYATGSDYKSKGQCLFFEVDPNFRSDYFEIDEAIARCVPAEDGTPKHSVYIAVYRVLEHLPISALGKLYLTTAYGHTLGLERGEMPADDTPSLHMYQDLVPVNSLVVSNLKPRLFFESVTSKPTKFIRFPGLFFVELELGELATDPENGQVNDLPYPFIHHLREALMVLSPITGDEPTTKDSKMVHRVHALDFPYRMVKKGFYVGNDGELAFYPMLSHSVLRDQHNPWWRSANS
ncbi:hypothetical protein [Propionivibrio limicola]|uniref:hypothetical protein n=1 Tax=Propionivibrio limicola TaxID=167645 RepID=UPI001291B32D|nr:hypothetical protein [Propionivibrio limicola]